MMCVKRLDDDVGIADSHHNTVRMLIKSPHQQETVFSRVSNLVMLSEVYVGFLRSTPNSVMSALTWNDSRTLAY